MSVCDWILNIKNEIIKIKKERSILWKLNIYQLRILNNPAYGNIRYPECSDSCWKE